MTISMAVRAAHEQFGWQLTAFDIILKFIRYSSQPVAVIPHAADMILLKHSVEGLSFG